MVWAPPGGGTGQLLRGRCCPTNALGGRVESSKDPARPPRADRDRVAAGSGLGAGGHDVHGLAAALGAELHRTGGEGEQRVVSATADAHARVELGAALTHQDLAGVDLLAAEALHTEALRVGITTVTGAGCALLACHVRVPPSGITPEGAELVAWSRPEVNYLIPVILRS